MKLWFLFWIPGKCDATASVELGDLQRNPTWFFKRKKKVRKGTVLVLGSITT